MTERADYYEPSGIFPMSAISVMILAGVVTSAITAPIAGLVVMMVGACGFIFFIPFAIAGFVHAMIAMVAVAVTGTGFHVRNNLVVKFCCFLVSLMGAYQFFHSVAWIFGGAPFAMFFPLLDPRVLYESVMDFVINSGDPQVAGGCVIALIVIDVLVYLFAAWAVASLEVDPYCESCQKWMEERKPVLFIEPKDAHLLKEEFEEGDFSALLDPLRKSYQREYAELKFFECESCEDSSYLRVTAHKKTPKPDKPGEYDEETDTVVDLIKVPHGLHKALLERLKEEKAQKKAAPQTKETNGES